MTPTDRTERYILKPAAEMVEGEPCSRFTARDVEGNIPASYLRDARNGGSILWGAWGRASEHAFVCALVDLHDVWHLSHRPTAPASSERVVPHYWSCNVNKAEWSCRCGQVIRDDDFLYNPDTPEDTLSGDCLAGFRRDVSRPVRKRRGYQSPATPPTPSRPPEPTEAERDAAVCAAWEDVMRWWELQDVKGTPPTPSPRDYQFDGPGHPTVVFFGGTLNSLGRYQGGTPSTLADYRASRSRRLRAKVAASKERERMTVLVDIDSWEFA